VLRRTSRGIEREKFRVRRAEHHPKRRAAAEIARKVDICRRPSWRILASTVTKGLALDRCWRPPPARHNPVAAITSGVLETELGAEPYVPHDIDTIGKALRGFSHRYPAHDEPVRLVPHASLRGSSALPGIGDPVKIDGLLADEINHRRARRSCGGRCGLIC
jgi:hypothetical protein